MKKLLNICALALLAGLQSCNFTGHETSNGNQHGINPGETPEKPAEELVMVRKKKKVHLKELIK